MYADKIGHIGWFVFVGDSIYSKGRKKNCAYAVVAWLVFPYFGLGIIANLVFWQ